MQNFTPNKWEFNELNDIDNSCARNKTKGSNKTNNYSFLIIWKLFFIKNSLQQCVYERCYKAMHESAVYSPFKMFLYVVISIDTWFSISITLLPHNIVLPFILSCFNHHIEGQYTISKK